MSGHRSSELNPPGRSLNDLPTIEPPNDSWPAIARGVARERARRGRRLPLWVGYAAAASMVLALGMISLLTGQVDQQDQQLQAWVEYSQELEQELDILRSRNQTLRGHRAVVIGELEQMVAAVDAELFRSRKEHLTVEQKKQLWRQRATLLDDLVNVQATARMRPDDVNPQPVITLNPPAKPEVRLVSYEL